MVKLRHYDHLGTARFITFPTYYRKKILLEEVACRALGAELSRMRSEAQVKLLGYVFMPEHVHLVLLPPDGAPLGKLIGQLKARSAHKIVHLDALKVKAMPDGESTSVRVWQARCYDHNCRTPVATREKIEYCHKNPGTRGLVNEAGQWRWSSFNRRPHHKWWATKAKSVSSSGDRVTGLISKGLHVIVDGETHRGGLMGMVEEVRNYAVIVAETGYQIRGYYVY